MAIKLDRELVWHWYWMMKAVEQMTATELEILLSGFDPADTERRPLTLEHRA